MQANYWYSLVNGVVCSLCVFVRAGEQLHKQGNRRPVPHCWTFVYRSVECYGINSFRSGQVFLASNDGCSVDLLVQLLWPTVGVQIE